MEEDWWGSGNQAGWIEMKRLEGWWKSGWGDMARKVPLGSVVGPQTLQFKQGLESRSASSAECSMKFWSPLYSFSVAAVANYHKFSGFKHHKFVILQFWKSEVQNGFPWAKARYEQNWVPSEGSRRSIFQLWRPLAILGAWPHVPPFKAHDSNFCFCGHISFFSVTLLCPPIRPLWLYWTHPDYPE